MEWEKVFRSSAVSLTASHYSPRRRLQSQQQQAPARRLLPLLLRPKPTTPRPVRPRPTLFRLLPPWLVVLVLLVVLVVLELVGEEAEEEGEERSSAPERPSVTVYSLTSFSPRRSENWETNPKTRRGISNRRRGSSEGEGGGERKGREKRGRNSFSA